MKTENKRFLVELIVAGSAVIISLCALIISYKQVNMMEEQMHLSVTPRITIGTSTDNTKGHIQIGILNEGIGPAEIISTEIRVDGAPVTDWDDLFTKIDPDKTEEPHNITTSKLNDILIGQQKYQNILHVRDSSWAMTLINNKNRISIRITYKSLFEDYYQVHRNSLAVSGAIENIKTDRDMIPVNNRFLVRKKEKSDK